MTFINIVCVSKHGQIKSLMSYFTMDIWFALYTHGWKNSCSNFIWNTRARI